MTQTEAMEFVRRLLFAMQRIRTMSRETIEQISSDEKVNQKVLDDLLPWVHGPKGDAFLAALNIVWNRGYVSGQEFYNFMAIVHTLNPELHLIAGFIGETKFPKPTIELLVNLGI